MDNINIQGHIFLDMTPAEGEKHIRVLLAEIKKKRQTDLIMDHIIETKTGCKIQVSGRRLAEDKFLSESVYDVSGLIITDIGTPENLNNLEAFKAFN